MSLSNATKNQQDIVSSTLQSYSSKNVHVLGMIYLVCMASGIDMLFTAIMTLPFLYDACVGFNVLKTIFSKNIEQREADLIEEVNKVMPK